MHYQIEISANIKIKVENINIKHLTIIFLTSLRSLFESFVSEVLLYYYEQYYKSGELKRILNISNYRKKTTHVKTKIKTLFGDIWIPQIQIRTRDNEGKEHQLSITRILLGIGERRQIPEFLQELISWVSAMSSYRVAHKIVGLLSNINISLMSLWHSVQRIGSQIKLRYRAEGINEFEADGTGVPTKERGKRGSELKKVFQRDSEGNLRLVGLSIGSYKDKKGWLEAMGQIAEAIKSGLAKFKDIILCSDGDLSIIESAKQISEMVKIQIDKWHVFHQLKYYLWLDNAEKEVKNKIISHFYKITMLFKRGKKKRDERISRYIGLLLEAGYKHSSSYLSSVMERFYTHEKEGNSNIYTTKTERSMRTTNQRINIGVWSEQGLLNICKIREAYYYNGISPLDWKNSA